MEPADNLVKRKVKQVPPVPIKTYQWEDVRRAKRRGKYPYTHLYKRLYIEGDKMEEEKENKPSDGEKKVRKVRKVKKKVSDASKKDATEKSEPMKEDKKEVLMEVEQLVTEETEITEIKLKEQPKTPEPTLTTEPNKMEIDEISSDKTEDVSSTEKVPTDNFTVITELRDVSAERTTEGQDIETISPDSEKIIVEVIETKGEKVDETKDTADKMSIDVSIGVVSKSNTESEDTYTDSNIEQYLDKEEVSKSVSDASCIEATTSMSDVELPIDTKQTTLDIQTDKKRKHSDLSEVTKSNLSLFEKMKNSKFKPPTFKIPKFKKLTFTKKNSKRGKTEPTVQKTVANVAIETQQIRKPESPVYIYIPLNPTPEDLEQERQARSKLDSSSRVTSSSSDPTNGNGFFNDIKDTNGTATVTTPKVDIKSVTSKWKSLQSKTDKKSPPFKKKSTKNISPETKKKTSPLVAKRRGDSPVEYIHIPLTGPLPPELIKDTTLSKQENENVSEESASAPKEDIELTKTKSSPKRSPKGAIKKKPTVKDKKNNDTGYKLAKDIKKLASKLKGIQKKNKKVLGSKKTSIKSPTKEESKTSDKKSSPTAKKRGDSPVQYIHIPLKGPLPDNLVTTTSTSQKEEGPVKEEILKKEEETDPTKIQENKEETKPMKIQENKEEIETNTVIEKKEEMETATNPEKEEKIKSNEVLLTEYKGEKDKENITVKIEPEDLKKASTEELKSAESDSKGKPENQEDTSNKTGDETETPKTPTTPGRSVDSILRMTGGSLSLENQKFVKVEKDEKKESLLTRMKSLKIPEKKIPSVKKKDIKSSEEEAAKPPKSPKKDTLEVVYPGMRHKDSIVEYILIPLKSSETETNDDQTQEEIKESNEMEVTDVKSPEIKKAKEAEESLAKTDLQSDVPIKEKKTYTAEPEKSIPITKTEEIKLPEPSTKETETKKEESVSTKGNILSKLKGLAHKTEKKPEKLEKQKTISKPLDVEEKVIEVKKHEESPPVEYIHIPLTEPENEQSEKLHESKDSTDQDTSTKEQSGTPLEVVTPTEISTIKIDEVQTKSTDVKEKELEKKDSNKEPAKKSLMSKLKGLKYESEKKAPTSKDEPKSETKSEIKKGDSPPAEYIFIPLKPPEETEAVKKIEEAVEMAEEAVEKAEAAAEEISENVPKSLEDTSDILLEPKITDEKSSSRTEQVEIEKQEPKKEKPKVEEASAAKQSVASKWRGLKVGLKADKRSPPTKQKSVKKISPKSEKKPAGSSEKSKPPMALRREESIVEYIHIPLNPTEEELIAEKEKNKILQESKKLTSISVARTPEPAKKLAETSEETKDTSKGAIKKQPQEKSMKLKDTTTKLTEDIKKFALKLKEMKNKTKKPTFKTFKRGSKIGSKKVSPPVTKKSISSDPLRIRPRREDSPVEYIFIPLNPTPEQLRIEQEREKLRQLARKPTAEEIKREKEKQRLRRISKTPAATTLTKTTTITKKTKLEKPKKKAMPKKEAKTSSGPSSSPFNTLKKTKELSKAKLKVLKDTMQQTKDKITEKKVAKPIEKKLDKEKEINTEITKKSRDSPDFIFIPLKGPETDAKQGEEIKTEPILSETTKKSPVAEVEKIIEEKALPEPLKIEKEDEQIKAVPEVEKVEEKLTESEKIIEDETHHYEPISKEDEEDGLKTAVPIPKETKQSSEEQTLKSVLKAADSPKLQKKVSFKRKSASIVKEQGLETNQNIDDDNVIYETIQIGEPEKPEKPSRKKETKSKSVEEQPKSDRDEDHEKWSKSTDHEYEPINPPSEPETVALKATEAPAPVHVTQLTDLSDEERSSRKADPDAAAATAAAALELRQLRIPLDDELVVASAETPEPDSTAERTSSPDTQATYLGTPTTTLSSRTDGISTSQVDSAALEHLPLKKEGRKKKLAEMEQAEPQGPNIQEKLKTQAGKLKTKIKSIKKPTFTIPNPKFSPKFKRPKFERPKFQRPKFQRPKFETPKFSMPTMPSMPKMPDRPKINFPSFSIPRPGSMRRQRSPEDRHISTTESSADSKKNIFDFRTYPRLFDKSKKKTAAASVEEPAPAPEFATVPRAAARKKGPVGSRWVHRFTDIQFADEDVKKPASYSDELHSKDRGDSLERRMEADLRYEQALAEAEADEEMREYERENQNISRHSPYHVENLEYTDRWRHGSFHLRDGLHNGAETEDVPLDRTRDHMAMEYEMQQSNRDERSSLASSGHRGVIEEIDSDQFFLREKGISQDNLQVGLYLSSEIRDAFRQPVNALSQMEREYDLDASDISLPRPNRPKRKHLKKTKRIKKTPHASQENISFDQESVNTEPEEYHRDYNTFPMPRPRRTKRSKMLTKDESLETSQGEMPIDDEVNLNVENLKSQEDLPAEVSNESLPNIIGYIEKDLDVSDEYNKYLNDESLMYENEVMQNIEQPEIIINADQKYDIEPKDIDKYLEHTGMVQTPKPPTRRQKSLKSLNLSEHDSILGEFNRDKMMQEILEQELNIYRVEHQYIVPEDENRPTAPQRTRSRSRTESQADDDRTSHGAESLITESEEVCEPPCRRELRDAMGYAIVDKSQRYREPPLPSTPRRRRSTKSNRSDKSPVDVKFFTVPRSLNDTPPVRPTRNYSTLGPNRPPRKKSELDLTEEEKENIDIIQYIEIEDDEHSKDLQSGEIINKMKGRPLPAPPRPPRKTRDRSKEALRDITQQSNIISDTISEHEKTLDISPASPIEAVEEIEVSTQTDPLPDDFCCEEFVEEPTDKIVAPTRRKRSIHRDSSIQSLERPKTPLERDSSIPKIYERPKTPLERASSPNAMIIERKVQTPVEDETITHASLLVRPVPQYPPDSFVSKRFGADIPDILPENIISSPVISHSEPEEISFEPELEESVTVPISETFSSDSVTLLPQSITEELISTREISAILTETPLTTSLPFESEIISEDVSEQVPEIPEKPQRRKSQVHIAAAQKPDVPPQPQIIERIIERQVPVCVTPGPDTEVEILRAQRLQVSELDVERLNVSELQANKILVSEIDGVSLHISELTSKSGNLVVNGLEIPSGLIQEILDRLQPTSQPPQQPSSSTEQVATQTSIEEPEPNTKEFTEPSTEQVATQTNIEIPDEQIQIKSPSTEQVATQTSVEELDDSIIPEEFHQLKTMPVVHPDHSEQLEHMEESIEAEEFEELKAIPTMQVEQLEHAGDSIAHQELVRLLTASPTIVVDPPEPSIEEPELDPEPEPEKDDEQDAIAHIRERIRFIEEEMSEFISDFTPDEMNEIKSEIESIIDIASDRVRSRENITEESEIVEPIEILFPHSEFPTDEIMFVREDIEEESSEPDELFVPYSQDELLDFMPELETDIIFLPQVMLPDHDQHTGIIVEEYFEPTSIVTLTEIPETQIHSETFDKPEEKESEIQIEPKTQSIRIDDSFIPNEIYELKSEKSELEKCEVPVTQTKLKTGDSIIPKEFHELKSEQAEIIENIQKDLKNEISTTPLAEKQTAGTKTTLEPDKQIKKEIKEHTESSQSTSSQPKSPPRPPLPDQEHMSEHIQPGQIFHELHYPLSYYPDYVTSMPPPGFYTMRSPQAQDISDEEVPVHHRRRRHHRHLSRSRSSSDEESRRTTSRRHTARSPEPSIPQLTGQLARACSTSVVRAIRQLANYLGSHLGTREGKHDLQIALVILLVLIAGLILLGFGSGKTIHLHHWEYFNPPKEL